MEAGTLPNKLYTITLVYWTLVASAQYFWAPEVLAFTLSSINTQPKNKFKSFIMNSKFRDCICWISTGFQIICDIR